MTWAVVFAFTVAGATALIALNVAARALETARRIDRETYEMGRYVIDHLPAKQAEFEIIETDLFGLTET